jgi:hypothetical protein
MCSEDVAFAPNRYSWLARILHARAGQPGQGERRKSATDVRLDGDEMTATPTTVTPVTLRRRTWAVARQPRFQLRCEERWRTDPVSEHLVVDDHRQRCHAQAVVQGSSGRVEVVSAGAQRDHLDAVASHVVERVGAQCGGDMVTSMG